MPAHQPALSPSLALSYPLSERPAARPPALTPSASSPPRLPVEPRFRRICKHPNEHRIWDLTEPCLTSCQLGKQVLTQEIIQGPLMLPNAMRAWHQKAKVRQHLTDTLYSALGKRQRQVHVQLIHANAEICGFSQREMKRITKQSTHLAVSLETQPKHAPDCFAECHSTRDTARNVPQKHAPAPRACRARTPRPRAASPGAAPPARRTASRPRAPAARAAPRVAAAAAAGRRASARAGCRPRAALRGLNRRALRRKAQDSAYTGPCLPRITAHAAASARQRTGPAKTLARAAQRAMHLKGPNVAECS